MIALFLFGFYFISFTNSLFTSEDECMVRSKDGVLQGKLISSQSGRVFCAFLGIPYAAPPVGKLRFLPPVSPQSWEGTRNCTQESNICLQKTQGGSEDCLYLNVFTHNTRKDASTPVMFYIHGGGFRYGSSSINFLGPEYLMDKDIVLITIQYRLGVFGFLSTEDHILPGNMGLKDQVKALQWVQNNIKDFGGDPSKVTIFGNSAGGASVHLHMQSPLSINLFTRGISQSGTALSTFVTSSKGKPKKDTEHMALSLNCSILSSLEILDCLQNKSSYVILDAYKKEISSSYGTKKKFRAVLEVPSEHAFIIDNPHTKNTDKPWLVGVNANEGLMKVSDGSINDSLKFIQSEFSKFGPYTMLIDDLYSNSDEIANLTYRFYFKNFSRTSIIESFEQLITDSRFVWPTEQAVHQHNGPLYYYLYDHNAVNTNTEIYGCHKVSGASHTDELLALFHNKGITSEISQQDANISKLIINLWVNFATMGNPTPKPISSNPQNEVTEDFVWKASNNFDPTYLHIQTNKLSMEKNIFKDRMDFWRNLPLQPI